MKNIRFFSTFSGIGGFEYGIYNSKHGDKFENIGYSEIDKNCTTVYKRHYPNHINYGDIREIRTSDLPDFDFLVGGFPCFTGDMLVTTKKGMIPIRDVTVNDYVLTHKNHYKHIKNIMVKPYHSKGYELSLNTIGKHNPIKCTPNHPLYVISRENPNPEWVEAKDLTVNHYVYVPYNTEHKTDISFTYKKWVNGSKYTEIETTLDDTDWWWCVGYYIGDGWYQKRRKRNGSWQKSTRITLACNPKECDYVVNRFSKFFKCNVQKDKRKIVFSNSCFYHFVKELGDNALEKHFPYNFDEYPIYIQKALLEGYVYADGHETEKLYGITTTSKELSYQVWRLFNNVFKDISNITFSKRNEKHIIENRVVNQHDTYQVRLTKNKQREQGYIKNNNGIWIKIRNIKEININEEVYNLEVETDHSYTINGIAVHNCQPFSTSGKCHGFEDTRGTLFFELARILEDKRPRYFLFENVRNILSNNGGETFKRILTILTTMGYDIEWEVYNSKDYQTPQNRERCFIKGYHRRECGGEILHKYRETKPCIPQGIPIDNRVLTTYRDKHRTYSLYPTTETLTRTLTCEGQNSGGRMYILLPNGRARKLTPIECERLQCFPDNYTKYGVDGEIITDNNRYNLIGNAVTTTVVKSIIEEMFDGILQEKSGGMIKNGY